jgi:3-isopropylmalate dehydratase small subunit
MSENNFNCNACNYKGGSPYHYNRHVQTEKHKKIIELKQARIAVYDNLYVCDMNKKSIYRLSKFNNDAFQDYNIWFDENFRNKNIKKLDVIDFAGADAGDKLINFDPIQNNNKAIVCPWCSEYNSVKNIPGNNLEMSLEDCFKHMKTCLHIHDHTKIEKNKSFLLDQALKIISDMVDNFQILSCDYELLKQRNEDLIKTEKSFNDLSTKFNKLKTKYDTLKEINRIRTDELFKSSVLNNSNSEKKVNLTINGNNNNINLLTYIVDNCKEAEPINAVDNSRKIAMNQLLLTKKITEITDQKSNDTQVTTPKINEIIVSPTASKIIESPDVTLPKMFIEGYDDNKNSYHIFIADILIKYFKKDDITKQPMWSTDISRCSYIIKILPDDWVKDKSGLTLLDTCIKPFIDYIDDIIRKYSQSLDDKEIEIQDKFMEETKHLYVNKFKGKRLDRFDFACIESCIMCNEELYNFAANKSLGLEIKNINTQQLILGEILACINKEGFAKKVIKEITPYFASDRLKLNPTLNIAEIPNHLSDINPKELVQISPTNPAASETLLKQRPQTRKLIQQPVSKSSSPL